MSTLQRHAAPFLKPMFFDIPTLIVPQGQNLIAAWLTMTAMVLELSDLRGPTPVRFYTSDDRSHFHAGHLIPPVTSVWLARREWASPSKAIYWSTSYLRIGTDPDLNIAHNGTVFTCAIGWLVMQLLVQRPDPSLVDITLLHRRHVAFADVVVRLPVPNHGNAFWPPSHDLAHDELEPFAYRWNQLPREVPEP